MKYIRFFILILGLVIIPTPNLVFSAREFAKDDSEILMEMSKEDKSNAIDPEKRIRTIFRIEHIDYETGEVLKVDDKIDGYVDEDIRIDEDFINAFRGYEYKAIKTCEEDEDKDIVNIKLSENVSDNKIYIYYESLDDKSVTRKKSDSIVKIDRSNGDGYLEGYSDGAIRPEDNITREEVAAVFFRLLNKDYKDLILTDKHNFKDIDMNRWSNTYIATLVKGNIVKGYADGSFRPDAYVSRGELVAMISRFEDMDRSTKNRFIDTDEHWAKKYIDRASSMDFIRGYEDGSFRPDDKLTRAEFTSIVNRLLARQDRPVIASNKYRDLDSSKWYYEDMLRAIK